MNIMDIIKIYESLKDNIEELIYTCGYAISDSDQITYIRSYLRNFNSFDEGIIFLGNISREINSDNELSIKINKFISRLNEISFKYNVHSFNEFSSLIKGLWNYNHFYDIDLLRIVLKFPEDYNLGDIYIDMVNESLVENPNESIGTSSEPIFTMLSNDERYYECNLKILSNPSVDWRVLRNGTTALEHFIYSYNNANSEASKKYYHDVIMNAIKSSLCIFNSRFYHDKGHNIVSREVGLDHLGLYPINIVCKLEDPNFIEEIRNYLLTNDGLNHQVSMYTDKNEYCDKIIEDFKSEIERRETSIPKINRLD